jgi:hypothetical protein
VTDLLKLADRVEALGYVECPMCGEDEFDLCGLSMHLARWCPVNSAIGLAKNDREIAANLRGADESARDERRNG